MTSRDGGGNAGMPRMSAPAYAPAAMPAAPVVDASVYDEDIPF